MSTAIPTVHTFGAQHCDCPECAENRVMGNADCCPECCVNLEAPQAAMRVGDGWHCEYLCGRCGHAWTTDWRN